MPPTLALTPPPGEPRTAQRTGHRARLAIYAGPLDPPQVEDLADPDEAGLIEALFTRTAAWADLPVLAVREVIENLIHARFHDALVCVMDGGRTVRVSDAGPGIADKELAMQPGFSSADTAARRVIRGVGSGLPLASALMAAQGGSLDLADNLGAGTVVTLAGPAAPAIDPAPSHSDAARRLLALLCEVGSGTPLRLAAELGLPLPECGRELALLEHRGLLERSPDGSRSLAGAGRDLITALF
jgi:Histidine kinase-, DNA gyrase B-, and HSP90-like ATPase